MDSSGMGPTYIKSANAIVLPIFSSFAIIILVVPFIWHWRLRNTGACSLVFYLSLANFFTFINAIIWPTEDYESWWDGAGLCDIEAKLKWPCVTGLACATLCITRNLANVLHIDRAEISRTKASRRRKMVVDIAICFAIPVLQVCLHYIIQYNRYYITVIGGCTPSFDKSWPTIAIMYIWPLIFCLINCYYAVAVIYRLHKYRSNFSHILSSSSNLTTSRFLRLFFMSFTLLFFYMPVTIYFFYVNISIKWLSYDWNIIHDPDHWWTIVYLPTLGVRTFDCYCSIAMAFFVFVYFGMGGDAIDIYQKWMLKVGLGRLFPCLNHERIRDRKGSWTSRLNIIGRARSYFDNSTKESNATTLGTSSDNTSTTRKPSCITIDHTSLKPLPLHPDALRQHFSSDFPDYISPPGGGIKSTTATFNLTPALPLPPDQLQPTKPSSSAPFLEKYPHFQSTSGSRNQDTNYNNVYIDLENHSNNPTPVVNLKTHIWGGLSINARAGNSNGATSSGAGLKSGGVRKETHVLVEEEIRKL